MPGEDAPAWRVVWAARLGGWLVRLLGATWRYSVSYDEDVARSRADGNPIVFALWHGQLLPLLYHHRGQGVAVLISEHADGEIIARIATSLGYRTVRGSTSRGAARALIGLTRVIEDGGDLAVTPDGPRGPAKSFAPGAAIVAGRTGAPMIGAAVHVSGSWRLKSWDRFQIPRPFATICVSYSDAVYLERNSRHDSAETIETMQRAMSLAESRADGSRER
ncbi:MAG: lysophospholipid acyltransferase family protein [Gemmatimonadaceae bacterium]